MWVFAVRNRPLDQTNASIVKNDVRMVWEVDAISAKANSTSGYEGERLATIHSANCGSLDWYDARDSGRVVRTYQEMDVGPVSLSSTTGCEAERQKLRIFSQCENILLRSLSFAQFIRLSWITSDEKKAYKPMRLSQSTIPWLHPKN